MSDIPYFWLHFAVLPTLVAVTWILLRRFHGRSGWAFYAFSLALALLTIPVGARAGEIVESGPGCTQANAMECGLGFTAAMFWVNGLLTGLVLLGTGLIDLILWLRRRFAGRRQ